MNRVGVIGAGSWGTALAVMADRAGHEVRIWSRNQKVVDSINLEHINSQYLKGSRLSERISATQDAAATIEGSDLIIVAIPSHAVREVLAELAPVLKPEVILVGATKGIEVETGKRMSEVVREVLAEHFNPRYVCLSGPSFAREVVDKHPTAIVAAGLNEDDCRVVQSLLSVGNLRIYTNEDLIGVELGGAVKNVIAIAAGMVAGLGYGSNSIAALITRGLAEMSRLALREGAKAETLMGLACLGDLVLTSTGALSRNRFVGQELGKGRRLEDISAGMNEVAEGIKTTAAVWGLATRLRVEMPITREVNAVLYEHKSAHEAARDLMTRPLREEF